MMALECHSHDPLVRKWSDCAVTEIFQCPLRRYSLPHLWVILGENGSKESGSKICYDRRPQAFIRLKQVYLCTLWRRWRKWSVCLLNWQAEGIDKTVSKWEVHFCYVCFKTLKATVSVGYFWAIQLYIFPYINTRNLTSLSETCETLNPRILISRWFKQLLA